MARRLVLGLRPRTLLVGAGLILAVWMMFRFATSDSTHFDQAKPQHARSPRRIAAVLPDSASDGTGIKRRAQPVTPAWDAQPRGGQAERISTSSDPLSIYLAQAVYPPSSRPLRLAHRDLIDWNRRHERPRPSLHDPAIEVLFSADRYWLIGEQPLRSFLRVTQGGRPLAVQIHEAWARFGSDPPLPLEYTRDVDGYANVLRLAQLDLAARASVLRLSVVFGTAHWRQAAALRFVVNPTAGLPARFSGDFDDRIEEGSLRIDVGIGVRRAGHYLVDCNLYGAHGEPVAWSRFKGRLELGDTQLPLRFFGKVIRDAEVAGPWSIGQLRGGRYVEGAAADMQMMAPFSGSYQTTVQHLSKLSDLPWQSPQKAAKIAKLEQLLASPLAPSIAAARP